MAATIPKKNQKTNNKIKFETARVNQLTQTAKYQLMGWC